LDDKKGKNVKRDLESIDASVDRNRKNKRDSSNAVGRT